MRSIVSIKSITFVCTKIKSWSITRIIIINVTTIPVEITYTSDVNETVIMLQSGRVVSIIYKYSRYLYLIVYDWLSQVYWFGCDPTEQSAVPHGLDASQMLVKTQPVQLDDGLYPLLQDNEQTTYM